MSQRSISSSRLVIALALAVSAAALAGCNVDGYLQKAGAETTAKVLYRAQPSLKQESDYELAARAIPATLKTLEGFYTAHQTWRLRNLLTEGYCQYGVGFVEDEWEVALQKKDYEAAAYHETRATKMFLRCLNYALISMGKKWQDGIFGNTDDVMKLIDSAPRSKRVPLMWVAVGLGSMINHNKDNIELVAQAPTAKAILLKIVAWDEASPPADPAIAALPHLALGLLYTAAGAQLGGKADEATKHFKKALELTGDKFLLARVQYARRVGVMLQDRKLFHDELVKVLQTDPAIWPEQRLANEIAHRRARRYLSQEKELF